MAGSPSNCNDCTWLLRDLAMFFLIGPVRYCSQKAVHDEQEAEGSISKRMLAARLGAYFPCRITNFFDSNRFCAMHNMERFGGSLDGFAVWALAPLGAARRPQPAMKFVFVFKAWGWP